MLLAYSQQYQAWLITVIAILGWLVNNLQSGKKENRQDRGEIGVCCYGIISLEHYSYSVVY